MNKELKTSYDVLRKVYSQNAFSSIELNKALQSTQASHGLVTKIVYGVLENDLLLTYYVSQFYTKKPKPAVLLLLKMGAYVSHFLNSIPPFALVNELVEMGKLHDKAIAGFLNATLKKVVNGQITLPSEQNPVERLSIQFSYPTWLVKKLLSQHSKEFVEQLLSTQLTTLTHIRLNNKKISQSEFEKQLTNLGIEFRPSAIIGAYFVNYEQLLNQPQLNPLYVVIGLTSMNFMDNVPLPQNAQVYDACASPGGKSAYLATLHPTATILAGDLHPHRVELMNKLMKKQQLSNVTTLVADATKLNENWKEKFDVVVCDVPCSGIGVVGKKPDILLNRKESDIDTLANLQLNILENCSNYVKPNGAIYYSTCTILQEENEQVVTKFLNKHPEFELSELPNKHGIPTVTNNHMVTYLPNVSNTEGFFIAKLVKKE